eukprot:1144929-Pelagomonas_calceolata.AAC.3
MQQVSTARPSDPMHDAQSAAMKPFLYAAVKQVRMQQSNFAAMKQANPAEIRDCRNQSDPVHSAHDGTCFPCKALKSTGTILQEVDTMQQALPAGASL